jgi:hypothetical protein
MKSRWSHGKRGGEGGNAAVRVFGVTISHPSIYLFLRSFSMAPHADTPAACPPPALDPAHPCARRPARAKVRTGGADRVPRICSRTAGSDAQVGNVGRICIRPRRLRSTRRKAPEGGRGTHDADEVKVPQVRVTSWREYVSLRSCSEWRRRRGTSRVEVGERRWLP